MGVRGRWSLWKSRLFLSAEQMFQLCSDQVFPYGQYFLKIEIKVYQIKFEAYESVISPQMDKKIRPSKLTSKDGFVTQNRFQ